MILFEIKDFAAQILFNVEGKHKIRLVPLAENRALLKLSFNSEREAAPESKGSLAHCEKEFKGVPQFQTFDL